MVSSAFQTGPRPDPFRDEYGAPLVTSTPFGALFSATYEEIKRLVKELGIDPKELNQILSKSVFLEDEREDCTKSQAVYKMILPYLVEWLECNDPSTIELKFEDLQFFMCNMIGNCVRRPIISHFSGEAIKQACENFHPDDKDYSPKLGSLIVTCTELLGWSRFVGNASSAEALNNLYGSLAHKIFLDAEATVRAIDASVDSNPEEAAIVLDRVVEGFYRFSSPLQVIGGRVEASNSPDSPYNLFTDAGHMINFLQILEGFARKATEVRRGTLDLQLLQKASLMIIEDNVFFWRAVLSPLRLCKNLTSFKVPDEMGDLRYNSEMSGRFSLGSRALSALQYVISHGQKPPDFILVDIELEGNENGLDFVEQAGELLSKDGKLPTILMAYSSNSYQYADRIKTLVDKGYLVYGWHKSKFNCTELVNLMNRFISGESVIFEEEKIHPPDSKKR